MGVDVIRKKLYNNELDFNMFNNSDSDNCKDKYNNLIYLLIKTIEAPKKSVIDRFDLHKNTIVLDYNKEAIQLYLHLVLDVLTNQSINELKLDSSDFSFITDLNGNLDLNTLEGKTIVLNQIRNAYAHKSGKIFFYEDNGIKKVKIDNRAWFSIEANLDDLNNLFEDITIIDNSNDIQNDIQKTIECIKKGKYFDIPLETSTILKLNLLMCYNKESIFDRFMQTQTSYIDASNFNINTTANWNCTEQKLRRNFFDKYDVFFHSDKDKQSYENEWKSTVDITNNTVAIGPSYSYNIDNMPFDSYTQRHIPIPIFLTALRDANSHGRIYKNGDKYVFYDQENQVGSSPYFYMEIDSNKLKEFLSEDYFEESILTTIDKHQNEHSHRLYLLEQAESANNFSNFMDIYKSRLQSMSERDVIKYMYDNNKFSTFLMEYPKQVEEFLDYKLSDGTLLIQILESFYTGPNMNKKRVRNDSSHYFREGVKIYDRVLADELEELKKNENEIPKDYDPLLKTLLKYKGSYKITLSENYEFFNLYYSFLRNLKSIQQNIKPININELNEEERNIIISGSEELKEEFLSNSVILDATYISDITTFMEIGMQQSRKSEFSKIRVACEYAKANKKEGTEEKRYTITNVEKRSNLSRLYKYGIATKIISETEEAERVKKLVWINLGLMLFRNIVFNILKNTPYIETPSFQYLFFITFGSLMFKNHFDILKSTVKMLRKAKAASTDIKTLAEYSDGGDLNVFESDGQDNIKRK